MPGRRGIAYVVGAALSVVLFGAAAVACATGTDAGTGNDGLGPETDGGADRDVVVIPSDGSSSTEDGSNKDGASDAEPDSPGPGCGKTVVINEVQTAGPGGAGDEMVELYNPGSCAVALTGWEVRYASNSGGAGAAGHKFTSGSIGAKGYLVLKPSNGTWTDGMAAASGQLGLYDKTGTGGTRIDGVGYGTLTSGAVSYRESSAAPSPPASGSIGRSPNGVDTNVNSADFVVFTTASPGVAN